MSGLALPLGLLIARATTAVGAEKGGSTTTPAAPARTGTPPVSAPPTTGRLTLPASTGQYRVGTTTLHLVDSSRPDPWVADQRVRELMVQFWYPARAVHQHPRAPYLTPATARAEEKAQMLPALNWPLTDAHLDAPVHHRRGGWPVVLYSHGLGGERSETTSLVQDLASHGYVVVTIDHIHDAGIVELPDGRLETVALPALTSDNEQQVVTKAIESRVADVRFVLDQLAALNHGDNPDHEHRPLPRGLRGALDLDRVGMLGHSDGGSTTAHALHTEARIRVGVTMDGTLWTPEATAGSDRPLLLFGRQDLDPTEANSWARLRANQRGPELQLNLQGSLHHTFTDFAALVPQIAPIIDMPPSWVTREIGTINGPRAVTVIRAYVNAYFATYLRPHHHRSDILLAGPSPSYPEVRFTS